MESRVAQPTVIAAQDRLNTQPLVRLTEALKVLRDATGNPELQLQTVATYLFIAGRHPTEVPMGEVEARLGLTQTSTSRNIGYLAKGAGKRSSGYRLITVEEDPFYRKRKLCRLSDKGLKVAAAISAVLGFA